MTDSGRPYRGDLELPKPPLGHFFRIASTSVGPVVEVRRKRRFGSQKVASSFVFDTQSVEIEIQRAAIRARNVAVIFLAEERTAKEARPYEGDYR